ncbi:putative ferric-chelate reductase 1 [Procambarus clarkii]|uniref:putative ferric-chelate reductase 1 n=1 Tax=Procambarus clarkii TaxID=6728 RepID=UPI0037444DA7
MCGLGHLGWVMCLLTVTLRAGQATGQEFLFTEHSCKDLVPRHRDAIRMAPGDKNKTNHVKAQSGGTNDTTEAPTETPTEPPSLPAAQEYSGDMDVEVLTSETSYRRLKSLIVTLQSPIYFNGFMVQARKVGEESGGEVVVVVGRFTNIPHRGKYLSCPNGDRPENTVVSEDAPLRMTNLTFVWLAPHADLGNIQFVASILYNGGTEYKSYSSSQLSLNMYPVSTKECAVAKSCFRYCTKEGGRQCEAHMSQYVATLEYIGNTTSVRITIGGQLPQPEGYLAVAFSKDPERLKNADIAACYRTENTEENTVKLEHYLLKDISFMPDLHLGVLELESWDVDGDFVWCTFSRPITGQQDNRLDLQEPQYYYYFWGSRNGSTISLPPMGQMKRSPRKISTKDKPFNQIDYSSGAGKQRSPYTIVAAVVLLLSVHFLCW